MSRARRFHLVAAGLAGALALAGCSTQAGLPPQQTVGEAPAGSAGAATTARSPAQVSMSEFTSAARPSTSSSPATTMARTTTAPKPKSARVSAYPEFGTDQANPREPLTVKVDGGQITSLSVYAEDGSKLNGAFTADKKTWTSDQRLRYGGSYRAKGTAIGPAGSDPTSIDGVWTTLDPNTQTTSISPGDGATVGVATPFIVRFGTCVADPATVEKHVRITTTPKVQVRGTWVQHDGDDCKSLDLRPKDFWPEGTRVHIEVDLLGVEVSDGVYGAREVMKRDVTIGRNQVTYADAGTHMITVKQDGRVAASYPTSMGKGDDVGDPRMVTRSGTHVVTEKVKDKKMTNEKFGYKDLPEPWSVRISNNGEFIHQNLETVGVQGKKNVSHGCLNLSDVNAKAYFQSAIYGDPVVVTGTSVPLGPADGDLYDWAIPWNQWHPLATEA